jgi:hydroxymethylglutaryl-CoA lyase
VSHPADASAGADVSPAGTDVQIVEVSPRDGLQNEAAVLPTEVKVELVRRLLAAGVTRIEAASFVHPRLVPQMADAEAVMAAVPRPPGVSYIGLVLNERGLRRAVDAGVDEVNYVVSATDGFSVRNQGSPLDEVLAAWPAVLAGSRAAGLRSTVTVSTSFGCPFDGEVGTEQVAAVVSRVLAGGAPDEVAMADTIGVGVPTQVRELVSVVRALAGPQVTLRAHFHNTRNTGYANAWAAYEAGVRVLDASAGGIGGCPFAPNATGNVATEDLGYLLHRSGVTTGLDLLAVATTGTWISEQVGRREAPALLGRAGPFPPT